MSYIKNIHQSNPTAMDNALARLMELDYKNKTNKNEENSI